LQKTKY